MTRRFGGIPEDVTTALGKVTGEEQLVELLDCLIDCPTLAAFRAKLFPDPNDSRRLGP
jgi:hypothetical protein